MRSTQHTMNEACNSWLKTCERNGLERSTLKAYRSHAWIHIDPKIGAIQLTALSRSDVREFMYELLDEGVSHALVRKVMVSLRAILSEAIEREWIEHNVATDVKIRRRPRSEEDDRIIPTKDEIRTILEKAPPAHRPLFITAIFTGMRISELRGLTWDAVDFDRRVISVAQRADEFGEIGAPKSRAGRRMIPMTPMVAETLSAWKARAPKSDQGIVFPNSVGKVQNYSNLYNRVFKPMLIEHGITDDKGNARFGIHALRHAAASLFIEQGWTAKKIQTLLGHASITMTMDVYGHLFDSPEEDVSMFAKLQDDLLAA